MTVVVDTYSPAPTAGMRVAFRVDASLFIGSGHVMRCLALAEALGEEGAACHFLCREHPGHLNDLIAARGYPVHLLSSEESGAAKAAAEQAQRVTADEGGHNPRHADWLGATQEIDARQSLEKLRALEPDWLIVDHYALDAQWESQVRDAVPGMRLMVIDDLADRPHQADVLLDQNLGRKPEDYRDLVPGHCRRLIGPRYALLRPEFAEWRDWSLERRRRGGPLKRLLVSLGGVDKDNVTGQVLDALSGIDLPEGLEITVVMGASAPWLENVRDRARQMPCPAEVVVNVTDMARHMAEADLAIGAAGSTAWERCCLGLTTIVLVLAENQQLIAHALHVEGAAHALPANDPIGELVNQWNVITQQDHLDRLSRRAASLVDGLGGDRVRGVLIEPSCRTRQRMAEQQTRLRPLEEADLETVREWRNHVEVRSYMYTRHEIGEAEHRAWFERVCRDDSRHALIFELEEQPVGFVQFSVVDTRAGRADWGFYLAPSAPRGSGAKLGECALTYAFDHLLLHKICGEALAFNERSIRFHERLGFTREAMLRDHHFDGKKYHDVAGFGLLAAEWNERKGA